MKAKATIKSKSKPYVSVTKKGTALRIGSKAVENDYTAKGRISGERLISVCSGGNDCNDC